MSGMMNAKRYTGCRCCTDPDDVARRQIEKREAEAEIAEELNSINEEESMSVLRDAELQNSYEAGYIDGCIEERERIINAIENAPPAMDFFGPYISKEKLYAVIRGE